jgi:hypothetical protein
MKWICIFSLQLFPISVFADQSLTSDLIFLLNNHQVLILGEKHRMPESTDLLSRLIRRYISGTGKCLAVALEIGSDQQEAIDRNAPMSEIHIHPIIDHPGYRDMLSNLLAIRQSGACVNILAVAPPEKSAQSGELHMADNIFQASGTEKVVALLGNNHAIKKVRWVHEIKSPSVVEQLRMRGVDSLSVLQKWKRKFGNEKAKGSLVDMNKKLAAYFMQTLAAFHPGKPGDVADKAIVWH